MSIFQCLTALVAEPKSARKSSILGQCDNAELTEMMSLGAGIPGDEQRIDMIKGLLAQWHKKVPVIICIEAGAAGMVPGRRGGSGLQQRMLQR